MILSVLMAEMSRQLRDAGITEPMRDVRLLAAHTLGISRDRLTMFVQDEISATDVTRLKQMIKTRAEGCPVSRIIGYRDFWGRRFYVDDAVLDPRPETEALIAAVLQLPRPDKLLDLGTGSGAIALTLAAEWPETDVIATDISPDALTIARRNAEALDLGARVTFLKSDWYQALGDIRADLIVSNPPYIAADEMSSLSRDVRNHDPRIALTDEADGLSAYRSILAQVGQYLTDQGHLAVEIGWEQGEAVHALFVQAGFLDVNVLPDMDGRDRVVIGKLS